MPAAAGDRPSMLREWQQGFAHCLRQPTGMPDVSPAHRIRFSIYRDNVIGSLVTALADAFPVTRLLVGNRYFDVVAADFARQAPPVAPRLSAYGEAFPAYLRTLPTLAELSYVSDVARLEWARIEAYFAGAAETVVTSETMLQQSPDALAFLRFQPAPGLRLLHAPTAIWSIWSAHQEPMQELSDIDAWRPQAVRLLCDLQQVSIWQISTAHHDFLQALAAGKPIIEAAEIAFNVDATFDLQSALADELRIGSFAEVLAPAGST